MSKTKQRGSRRFKVLLHHRNLQVHTLCHGTLYLEDDARSLGGVQEINLEVVEQKKVVRKESFISLKLNNKTNKKISKV